MNSKEIRDIAIDSSKAYYEHLDRNEKGIREVSVFEISYPDSRNFILKLKLSAKLFDIDAIFFKNLKTNKKYDVGEVKIIEYDKDKNILLIKPNEEATSDFKNLNSSDLKVISDLKFLIERVKVWYELNGANISLPKRVSKLSSKFKKIEYFPEKEFQPSDNQKESLKNIFTNPFSYIWGAPGTGKTQFVLAYAIMHYIKHNDKIAILAPTNNSIEQVLRGVLKMTDKAGIERNKILRLGTPSSKFAEEFPQVCEEKGLQNKIKEIDKQINILESMIAYSHTVSELNSIERNLESLKILPSLIEKIDSEKSLYNNELKRKKKKEIDVDYAKDELNSLKKSKTKAQNKLNSFGNKIKKLFSFKSTITVEEISIIEDQIKTKIKELEYLKYEYTEIDNSVSEKKLVLNKSKTNFYTLLENFKTSINENEIIKKISQDINPKNWQDKVVKIKNVILKKKDELEVDSQLFVDYKFYSAQQLQDELNKNFEIREKLSNYSTEEKLKTVNVVACTLDGYIGRYAESKLDVEHIFLDEAGYANIVKTLTLFNNNVPISLLGDHMQLPPVCEINDKAIKKNHTFRNMFLWSQSSIHSDSLFQNSRDVCLNKYLNNSPFNPSVITNTSLDSTYRFGNNIANILANHIYKSGFKSSNPNGETSILFIDAPKIDSYQSRISISEVEVIKKVTDKLKMENKNDFVILTPYKDQIRLLNNHMPEERNELKILTVHGSQGREWDTVILSVVDTSDKWFVDSTNAISKGLNLVNTAVSRAKKNLIIVCDKNYWINQNGQLITDLLKNGNEYLN